jgi:hypothetical protein
MKEVFKIVYKGLPPKDEDQRVNRIPKRFDKTIIDSDEVPTLRGIDLPEIPGVTWCDQTREWWRIWRTSPQAKLMGDTDWQYMIECAIAHNEIFKVKNRPIAGTTLVGLLAELRQRVAKFGATWEDRAKLQLQINIPQTEDEAEKRIEGEATAAVDYAERLLKKAAKEV